VPKGFITIEWSQSPQREEDDENIATDVQDCQSFEDWQSCKVPHFITLITLPAGTPTGVGAG
jgi:hypothetical protein